MIKPEQIPDEVAWKLHDKLWSVGGCSVDDIRAAIAAALNAWPEMERERIGDGCEWPLTEEFTDQIILPLTEASDDQ